MHRLSNVTGLIMISVATGSFSTPINTGVGVLGGLLYAVGGHDGPLVRKSVEVYNPSTDKWSPVADMNFCRRNAGN